MHMQLFNNAENTMRNTKREGEYWFDLTAYTYAAKLVAKLETNQTMDSLSGISLGEVIAYESFRDPREGNLIHGNLSKCQVGKSHMQPQQMCLQF